MARRRFTVRDIAEILEHWQAGRSICAISRSLGVCRATVRKYVYAAESRGYHQGDPPPAEEAQIDFGYLGMWQDPKTGKRYRLWAFALILSFSRHMFVRVVTRMDQREWLMCHTSAFEFFGGAPKRIVPDNLKSGIIKADLYDPKFNQGYEELAHHYGIIIDPAAMKSSISP